MKQVLKRFLNKRIIVSVFGILSAITILTVAFSWFTGTIEKTGIKIETGNINVSANSYYYKNSTLTQFSDLLNDGDTSVENGLAARIDNKADDNVYFIVNKNDTTSIDCDFYISLTLENGTNVMLTEAQIDEETRYIGSFWYKFSEITKEVNESSLDTFSDDCTYNDYEKQLVSYINDDLADDEVTNTGTKYTFDKMSGTLVKGSISNTTRANYFILSYGCKSGIETLTNRTLQIRANLTFSQVGALTEEERSSDYINVSTNAQFREAILSYLPGQTIKITADVSYNEDLVFSSPVNLEIVGATLTITGNLMYSFPYSDAVTIDTSAKGVLLVKKQVDAQSGGYIEIDCPNCSFEFIGKGYGSTSADIYLQEDFIISASYDKGAIFTKCNIYTTDSSGNIPNTKTYKTVYFGDSTRIEVAEDTYIYSIQPYVMSTTGMAVPNFVCIYNYGTINHINLAAMNAVSTYLSKPQILIDNYKFYGNDTENIIYLPVWSSKFEYNDETKLYQGNTTIIQEYTSNTLYINCPYSALYGDPFDYYDVIRPSDNDFVEDISEKGDDSELLIKYHKLDDIQTIEDILWDYFYDDSKEEATNESNYYTAINKITKLKISCSGDTYITSYDTSYLEDFENLKYLDLEDSNFTNNTIPDKTFQNYINLENIVLPNNITTLGNNMFDNTKVQEITIPSSCKNIGTWTFYRNSSSTLSTSLTMENWCFFLHIEDVSSIINMPNMTSYSTYCFFLVDSTMVSTYRASLKDACKYMAVEDGIVSENKKCIYSIDSYGGYKLSAYIGGDIHDFIDENNNFRIDEVNVSDTKTIQISTLGWRCLRRYIEPYCVDNVQSFQNVYFGNGFRELEGENFCYIDCQTIYLNNIQKIGSYEFYYAKETSFIGENLITMGNYALNYNVNLTSLELKKLNSIGYYGISYCSKLEYLNIETCNYFTNAGVCYNTLLTTIYMGVPQNDETPIYEKGSSLKGNSNLKVVFYCGEMPSDQNYVKETSYHPRWMLYEGNGNCILVLNTSLFNDLYEAGLFGSYSLFSTLIYSRVIQFDGDIQTDLYKAGERYLNDSCSYNYGQLYCKLVNDEEAIPVFCTERSLVADDYETPGSVTIKDVTYDITTITDVYSKCYIKVTNFTVNEKTTYIERFTGSGANELYNSDLAKTITNFKANGVTSVGDFCFAAKLFITNFEMLNLKTCGNYNFCGSCCLVTYNSFNFWWANHNMISFGSINLPSLESMGYGSFCSLYITTSLNVPKLEKVGGHFMIYVYANDISLNFPSLVSIDADGTYNNDSSSDRSLDIVYCKELLLNSLVTCNDMMFYNNYSVIDYLEINKITYLYRFSGDGNVRSCHQFLSLSLKSLVSTGYTSFTNISVTENICLDSLQTTTSSYYFNNCYMPEEVTLPSLKWVNKSQGTTGWTFYNTKYLYLPELIGTNNKGIIMPDLIELYAPKATSILWIADCPKLEKLYIPSTTSGYILYHKSITISAGGFANLRDIFIGHLNFNTSDFISRNTDTYICPSLQNIYVCGENSTISASWTASNISPYNINIYVYKDIYDSVSSIFKPEYNFNVINCNEHDPYELKDNGFNELEIEGFESTYYEYQYFEESDDKISLVHCNIDTIDSDTFNIGGSVVINDETKVIKNIYDYCYANCTITSSSVVISDSILNVGDYAFRQTSSALKLISYVTFNNNGYIGKHCFDGVSTLSSIIIGENVNLIKDCAFNDTNGAAVTIYYVDSMLTDNNIFGTNSGNILYVGGAVYTAYQTAAPWGNVILSNIHCYDKSFTDSDQNNVEFLYNIEDGIAHIVYMIGTAPSVLTIPSIITEDDINYSVTKVDSFAFKGLVGLTSVVLPSTLTSFDYKYYNEPSTLTSYSISGNSYYATEDGVLFNYGKTKIISYPKGKIASSYSVPTTVTKLDTYAFAYNTFLTTLNVNSKIEISDYCFKGCTGLTSVSLENSESDASKLISSYAFDECTNLVQFVSDSTTTIESYAFNNCSSLNSVTLNGSTTINSYAFNETATDLIVNANKQLYLYSYAFANSSLNELITSTDETRIYSYGLANATNLETVYFGGVVYINAYGFYNDSSLSDVTFNKYAYIYSYAFSNTKESIILTFNNTNASNTSVYGYNIFDGVEVYSIIVPTSIEETFRSKVAYDQYFLAHINNN